MATATLLPATPSQAAAGDNPGALRPLTSSSELAKLQLVEHRVPTASLDNLASLMGTSRGVSQVLASANHPMRNAASCDSTESAALPVDPQAESAYCWDSGDATTQDWLPQSVTSSGDADNDGSWGDNKVILAGWTNRTTANGEMARVAFIDANDPSAFKYRWVLLTVPLNGGTDYKALKSHMGGMSWYQDKLYVTSYDTDADHNVMYVFDMGRILQATVNSSAVGKVDGGWSADGYQYVMPAIGSYSLAGGGCSTASDNNLPCFASISLDRSSTPDSLVATEWFSSSGSGGPARVWRYNFSTSDAGWLSTDSSNDANATEAYETSAVGVQGVLSHKPSGASEANWYVDDARGGVGQHGILWRQNSSGAMAAANCGTDTAYACWGKHTESMSYWWSTGRVWTLTEWAANADAAWEPTAIPERVLYSVPLSSIDSSLDN
ncbi:hypothetical protein [Actinacidiphila oryziradicis]|uniref:Secreted protein n=1 Tax=Actinacidiphila oryziradicis TaxID=2571141 RepID=A0A4U0SSP8_9ACTN|nr:hypothetical protein [Actinacidiphila oryziradicis]TKA13234.1 hypothetical protein FCI23_00390 [Actinacidiphila oryziradicis]